MNLHFFILYFLEINLYWHTRLVFSLSFYFVNVHFSVCLIPAMSSSTEMKRKLILSNLFLTQCFASDNAICLSIYLHLMFSQTYTRFSVYRITSHLIYNFYL